MMSPIGRGLTSLFDEDELDEDSAVARALRSVPLDEIRPNPEQPRLSFDPRELEALAASIGAHGILSPLVVRRHEGRYVLIAGERRLRAAAIAGLKEVPVLIKEAPDRATQLELALVENLQRSDLDPVEAARGYQRLISEYGYTQDQVAAGIGRNRATVANAVRLLKLPDFVLDTIQAGRITAGHGKALIPVEDHVQLERLLVQIELKELSVRATEALVSALLDDSKRQRADELKETKEELKPILDVLQRALHTQVDIRPRQDGSGRIVIEYASADELERLIDQIQSTT
ncbi:MAG: ParB/RepB/Spo0J family partition protein [Deltaproteobacteria bacterium]|nr:ParB/RepB/Spo0J family partition protein [Deltaproteobacteria bacterium]